MPDTHDERGGDETPLARVQTFQRAANPNGDYHWPAEEAANVNGVPLYFDDIESLSAADNFDAVDAVVARWRKAEEQLAAATARAEKAEALVADAEMRADKFCGAFSDASSLAYRRGKLLDEALTRQTELARERDEARELACASLDILRNVSDEPMRELYEVDDMGELPNWFTGYGKPSATLAPDVCRSCGTAERIAGDPPLCSNCAVYGPTYRGVACWPPIAAPEARSEPVERSETPGGHGEGEWRDFEEGDDRG